MKKNIFLRLLSYLLLSSIPLTFNACSPSTQPKEESSGIENSSPTSSAPPTSEPSVQVIHDYKVTESLYSETLAESLQNELEVNPSCFKALPAANAPFMMQDGEFISNGRILSLSFPVAATKSADSNGDFTFTIYVYKKNYSGIRKIPLQTFAVKINAQAHGLDENASPMKWIKVDLREYNIILNNEQTLVFFSENDTLIPAYTEDLGLREQINTHTKNGMGFLCRVGSNPPSYGTAALLFDVEIERTFKTNLVYQAMLDAEAKRDADIEALKAIYSGKKISILGDSISTYGTVSNNPSYNTTIGNNAVFYQYQKRIPSAAQTYWGQLIDTLDMTLCVNNSWSGSRVYGKPEASYLDSAVNRATQLHRDGGTPNDPSDDTLPDVIIFYMGINDTTAGVPFGTTLTAYDRTSIDTWFQAVLNKTSNATDCRPNSTYSTFEEAYALTLYKMKQAYPNAEIHCINLIPHLNLQLNDSRRVPLRNDFIEAIASYFEVGLIDHHAESGIKIGSTAHFYMLDQDQLHPNAGGHERIANTILNTLIRKKIQS